MMRRRKVSREALAQRVEFAERRRDYWMRKAHHLETENRALKMQLERVSR